jgi:hypothetical protein
MKTTGNLILMTLICIVIFMVFMAIRPVAAHAEREWCAMVCLTEVPRGRKCRSIEIQRCAMHDGVYQHHTRGL